MPLIFRALQCPRRADKGRHVGVVSAHVANRNILAFVIFRHHFARIRQTGLLMHRQRVHIGAHQHSRSIAIFHHANDAVAFKLGLVIDANVIRDFAAGCA